MYTKEELETIAETQAHIDSVAALLENFATAIRLRAANHDASKLVAPELQGFTNAKSSLKGLTYGSQDYKDALASLKPTLDHHYANNRHHPEHWANGIEDMTLVDVVEMFFDWYAATKRHADGDIMKSIDINEERFGINEQLSQIFINTVKEIK